MADNDNRDVTISKIAEITVTFWILKILATTLGETAGDYLSMTLDLGYLQSLGITTTALILLVSLQVILNRFHPLAFWIAIVATTTAGTEVSDFMDRTLGVGYIGGSLILSVGLAITFVAWVRRTGTLRVEPMTRKDTEIMFWIAVVFSNSLGTAFGDFLIDDLGLTFIEGSLATAGIIALVALLHYMRAINDIALFWIAFIFTRPFGATFGDFLTKPISDGALALPRETASLVTIGLMGLFLILSARSARRRARQDA
ncbi:MAG: membrane protein [Rhodothalassiaceae bacterium]